MRTSLRSVKEKIVRRLALSHLAGRSQDDALDVTRRATAIGWNATICLWNEPDELPSALMKKYSSLISSIRPGQGRYHISLKTPAFQFRLDMLEQITDQAALAGIGVEFDAHGPDAAQPTLDIVKNIRQYHNNIFLALPARWQRSVRDAEWAVEQQIGVRIVKGQWRDPADPNLDCRKNYLAIVDRLASRSPFVSIATHEPSLAREALRRLKDVQTPCELEVMFSLPMNVTRVAEHIGVPIRVYVPYGYPSLPYNISSIRTRPAVALWALRNFVINHHPRQRPLYA